MLVLNWYIPIMRWLLVFFALLAAPAVADVVYDEVSGTCIAYGFEWTCGPDTGSATLEPAALSVPTLAPSPPPPPESSVKPYRKLALADYSAGAFVQTAGDASGVAYMEDGTLMIALQRQVQLVTESGKVISTAGSGTNDLEGLELVNNSVIGANESPGRLMKYSARLQSSVDKNLSIRNIECIAEHNGVVYYGLENSGQIVDETGRVYVKVGRDLAGCTFFEGALLVVTSHPYRASMWSRVDPVSWKVIESRRLAKGNWEGVSCRENSCVIIREASAFGEAGFQVWSR